MEVFEDIEEKKKRIEKEEAKKRKEQEKIEREEKKKQKELEREEKKRQREIEKEEKRKQKELALAKKQEEKRIKQLEKELKKTNKTLTREQMLEIINKSSDKSSESENNQEEELDTFNEEAGDPEEEDVPEYVMNKFDFSNEEIVCTEEEIDDYWRDINVEVKNIKIKNGYTKEIKIHKESNVVFEIATNETLREYDLDDRYINQKIFVGVLDVGKAKITKEIKLCDTIKNWVYKRGLVVPSYEICRLDFEDELNSEF